MTDKPIDVIVIGAGVVGLAIARRFAMAGNDVLIVERGAAFGMETSARNSEVMHAGIYYVPGSLKATLCLRGRDLLQAFCDAHSVPYRQCGKLIVATNAAQAGELDAIRANAAACGMDRLEWRDRAAVAAMEPDIVCDTALFSPFTGILDSHAYMLALLGEAEAHGAHLVCNTEVTRITRAPEGWALHIAGEDGPVATARTVINSAGLGAVALANRIEGLPASAIPLLRYAKGCYFSYGGRTRFRHLVYPVPEPGGLGTHLTLDLAGQARFGPDVTWIDAVDYDVPESRRDTFARAVHQFWPGADPALLLPAYAGVRPKLSGPGEPAADFSISGPAAHGVAGLINLFGIESPGLTASLALAEHVFDTWKDTR